MDDQARKQEGTNTTIWVRYATQFTTGGRTHTIEMSVPLPVGATPERREQLLREAEAGLSHLMNHVENRIPHLLQRAHTSAPTALPASPAKAAERSTPRVAAPTPSHIPVPPSPANQPQVRESSLDLTDPAERQEAQAHAGGGASMPSMPGSGNGNLTLPEFIQAIKVLGLSPRQAMDRLKVKSLSTGVNLREAFDRLETMVIQEAGNGQEAQATSSQAVRMRSMMHPPAIEDHREDDVDFAHLPAPAFDEEIEPGEEDEDFSGSFEDEEGEEDLSPALTADERNRARSIIDRLREMRGATTVNNNRLKALNNVIGDQISPVQLQALIHGVWSVSSLNKLKVDQVEELIHWAKQDEFVSEAEAVLILLEEEG